MTKNILTVSHYDPLQATMAQNNVAKLFAFLNVGLKTSFLDQVCPQNFEALCFKWNSAYWAIKRSWLWVLHLCSKFFLPKYLFLGNFSPETSKCFVLKNSAHKIHWKIFIQITTIDYHKSLTPKYLFVCKFGPETLRCFFQ